MHAAVRRPHLTAGVAFLGAGVIAAAAVTPMPTVHLPDLPAAVHTAAVDLAALANPLEAYAQVFQTALANTDTLVQNTVPGQLLNQILQNQVGSAATLVDGLSSTGGAVATAAAQVPAALTTAVAQLTAGNVSGAVNTLLGIPLGVAAPALDLLPALQAILTKPLENVAHVINAFTGDPLLTLLAVSGFVAPLISAPAAAAAALQHVLDAVGTGDLGAVANAIIAAPATIADGVLNGGYGPNLGPLVGIGPETGISVVAGGLLSSNSGTIDPATGTFVINTGGPLYSLQQVLKMITQAIAPPAAPVAATATTTIASLPAAAATTVPVVAATTPAKTVAAPADTAGADETESVSKPVSEPATQKPTDEVATVATPANASESPVSAEAPVKKPTASGVDVTTGNKVEPSTTAGTDAPKSGGSVIPTSTPEKATAPADEPAGSTTSAGGADTGAGGSKGNTP